MESILAEHAKDPNNWGTLSSPSITYTEKNASCGEFIVLHLQIENEKIEDIAFTGDGRSIMIAAMSLFIESYEGESLEKILAITPKEWLSIFTLPLSEKRKKSVLLPLLSTQNAIKSWKKLKLQSLEDYLELLENE